MTVVETQIASCQMICHCLQVSEETVVDAIVTLELRTVRDVRRETGAGDGCTACHRKVRCLLERHSASSSSPEICCAK